MAESCQKIETLHYPVLFGQNIRNEVKDIFTLLFHKSRLFVLTDENVANHCLPVVGQWLPGFSEAPVFKFPAGESSKHISTVVKVWKWLMNGRAGRDSVLVNLGGGVVSDLGGFIAGTLKRGIRYANIPTSLIGQADASVGGKTGINIGRVKNQAGIFHDPSAVFIDTGFLQTLPQRELLSGYAELIKSALLSGGEFWEMVRGDHSVKRDSIPELTRCAINFKCAVVARDPRENGRRKILNFGHTCGHAFEGLAEKDGMWHTTHGEAVAAGMICEGFLSNRLAGLSRETLNEMVLLITSIFKLQPVDPENRRHLLKFIDHDKKSHHGIPRFVLLESAGNPVFDKVVEKQHFEASIDFYNQIARS